MTVKVVGFWNFGWTVPISEFHLWEMIVRDFHVHEHIMCPVSGIDRKVTEYKNMIDMFDNVFKKNPGIIPVFIDEEGEVELQEFDHPSNALYILGKTSYSAWKSNGKKGRSVRIQTPAENSMLEPHQALAIVLYDRMLKENV
jgi:hypothetical protein